MYNDNWNIEIRPTQQRLPPIPDGWEDSLFYILYALVNISNNNHINYRMIHSMISKWFLDKCCNKIKKKTELPVYPRVAKSQHLTWRVSCAAE